MASSISPPGGAGPSAISSGSMPRAEASTGVSRSARKRNNRRNIVTALVGDAALVEVRPKPALSLLERNAAPGRVILQLVAADPRHAEILAVAVAEIEARHRRSRQHGEVLGQRDVGG